MDRLRNADLAKCEIAVNSCRALKPHENNKYIDISVGKTQG